MPPTDRLLEARKTYADLAAASQSLREQATALDKAIAGAAESVASLRTELSAIRTDVSHLHEELGELASAVAIHRRVLLRTWVMIIVPVVLGGLLGFLLGSAAADAWPWLLSGQEPR